MVAAAGRIGIAPPDVCPEALAQIIPGLDATKDGAGMDGAGQICGSVLLHYHIYKNAGSSIDRILRESLGARWGTFEGSGEPQPVSTHEVADFLAEQPHLLAVSSHLARPPLPARHVSPIVMLRHPIDRARSVYHYARCDPTTSDHQAACNGSFRDYVEWSLGTPGVGVVIRNYQVIHLSSASFRCQDIQFAEANDADLAEVKALLLGWPAFGIVRAFADSCRLLQAAYGTSVPGLRFIPRHENRSTDRFLTEARAIDLARSELGAAVFQRLVDANRLDLELYDFACRVFRSRLAELELSQRNVQPSNDDPAVARDEDERRYLPETLRLDADTGSRLARSLRELSGALGAALGFVTGGLWP